MTGTVLFVRDDSTAWQTVDVRQAVATSQIARIERHRQTQHITSGLLIGGGIAVGMGVLVLAADDGLPGGPATSEMIGLVGLLGLGYGAGLGTIQSRRRVYVLRR